MPRWPRSDIPVDAEPAVRAQEILMAGARLFRRKGYSATTVQDIADAVGLLKGSLYYYFPSKRDILDHITRQANDYFMLPLERILASQQDPEQKLRQILINHVEVFCRYQDEVDVFLQHYRLAEPALREQFDADDDRYTRAIGTLIAEGLAQGVFQPRDARLAALGVLGMCSWIHRWYRPGGPLSPPEMANVVVDQALASLGAAVAYTPGS